MREAAEIKGRTRGKKNAIIEAGNALTAPPQCQLFRQPAYGRVGAVGDAGTIVGLPGGIEGGVAARLVSLEATWPGL